MHAHAVLLLSEPVGSAVDGGGPGRLHAGGIVDEHILRDHVSELILLVQEHIA